MIKHNFGEALHYVFLWNPCRWVHFKSGRLRSCHMALSHRQFQNCLSFQVQSSLHSKKEVEQKSWHQANPICFRFIFQRCLPSWQPRSASIKVHLNFWLKTTRDASLQKLIFRRPLPLSEKALDVTTVAAQHGSISWRWPGWSRMIGCCLFHSSKIGFVKQNETFFT